MSSHPVNSKHDFLFCGFEKIRSINLLDKVYYLCNIKSLQLRLRIEGNRIDFYVLIHSMKDATLGCILFWKFQGIKELIQAHLDIILKGLKIEKLANLYSNWSGAHWSKFT